MPDHDEVPFDPSRPPWSALSELRMPGHLGGAMSGDRSHPVPSS